MLLQEQKNSLKFNHNLGIRTKYGFIAKSIAKQLGTVSGTTIFNAGSIVTTKLRANDGNSIFHAGGIVKKL
uniref:Serine/threonine protein kinase n=1 Tax=Globodera pallida TaxID=36090 RepID=A0A183CNF5_GLOPA